MRGLAGDSLMSTNARILSEADANRNVLFERWAAPPRLLKFREVHPLGRTNDILAANPASFEMKRNRCSVQRLPIQGGTAKKCAYLEQISRRRVFLPRRWGLPLFFGCAVLGACAAAAVALRAQDKNPLLEMRRRRSWANRNSGRTARFATGWARGAAAGDLI